MYFNVLQTVCVHWLVPVLLVLKSKDVLLQLWMEWKTKSPESHEKKRQLNLQKRREQIKAEQDLPLKQKSNANEGFNSAVKRENVVSNWVAGLKKEARKHRSDSKPNDSTMPADFSVKQPNKRLSGRWIKAKVMLATMKMIKNQQRRQPATRALILHNQ